MVRVLQRKTWRVRFNRSIDWNALGFVNHSYRERRFTATAYGQIRLHVSSYSTARLNRFIERVRATKRNVQITEKRIQWRDYKFKVPFYFDSFALKTLIYQYPHRQYSFGLSYVQFHHQAVVILSCDSKDEAIQQYNKIETMLREFELNHIDARRLKHVESTTNSYDHYRDVVIRGRECDKCLAIVTRLGADAVLFRILRCLYV